MGIKLRHDVAGIMQTKDNSRFNAGMQMVQRQQERDDAMRSSKMQPLKYNTGGTYGGIGIGDQKKKAKPGVGAEQVFGVDAALPPMPAWQEQNSDIMKNIEAGAYSNPVSRQLRNLVTRQQMLMSSQTLNDAQKKDAFDRFERNKRALIEANPLDPSVEVAVRDQQQNAGPSFEQWARTNTKEFNTDFRNTQTKLIEQGIENPTNEQIIQAMRQPWDAMRSMNQPKPSQPPAAAVGDDNPYEKMLDELQKQQGIGERRYGGPVYPGQTVTVGEEGPEVMRVGYDGVAQVAPNPATMARMQGGMPQPMNYAANPQGGGALPNYDPPMFLTESVADQPAPAASQPQQAQTRRNPLEGMTQRQIEEMYAYNRAQQNAAPATASDRAKMQQQTQQRTPPTAEQSRERYQQWEKEYDQWKRTTANALYNERPVLGNTPSIGKPRVWTDNKGRKITGELRGVRHFNDADPSISDAAIIRRDDGETFVIPLETLSPQDQAIVIATPDYASENRMGGRNLGTYDSFDPSTPEGQRSRQPQPRQTPTPEQLETRRTNEFGFSGVDAGIREGRLGRRRETPPAYKQPVLGDGQIATVPGLASPPGTRTVGPNGERLPPAGANADPRDVNTYTQWLAHLGPTEGAKFTASLKKKGMWGSRYSITEKLLAQEGLLKKRGVDGYGKPYESPSDELQFQPPARPAYWDSWKDSTAQERRLTPAELAQRGLMVNPQGQVVQMPRDPQGRPVMPATTSPQTAAQTPAKKFDPTSPMASDAIKTLLREHTEKEREDNLRILAKLNAPADFIASLTGRTIKPGESPAAKPEEPGFSITDPQDRSPLDVLRRAIGLRGSSTSQGKPSSQEPTQKDIKEMTTYLQSGQASEEEKQIITDILRNAGVNVNDIKTSVSPAKPPKTPQQGFPSIDAMASQVAQQQTQTTPSKSSLINQEKAVQSKPLTLPKEQPALQDKFWNSWWSTQPAAYQAPEDQDRPEVTLTAADEKRTLTGTVELISNPIAEIGGQRVITFKRKDGAVITFYSGQLSEEDESKIIAKAALPKKYPRNSDVKDRKKEKSPDNPDAKQNVRPSRHFNTPSKYPSKRKTT